MYDHNMQTVPFTKESVKNAPETAGVYIFRGKEGTPIYIGKAKNLKNRLNSYIQLNLGVKTSAMTSDARELSFIPVASEFEALLLEANLVKKYYPKYNIELKDDKSPLYIGITKSAYPYVVTLRQTQLQQIKLKRVYGPFIDGGSVRRVLRILRQVTPYSHHKLGKRPCLYHQIGLCNPCPSQIERETDLIKKEILQKQYRRNLFTLTRILSGKIDAVKKDLLTHMKEYSAKEEFEEAARLKDQLRRLEYVTAPSSNVEKYVRDPQLLTDIREGELTELSSLLEPFFGPLNISRLECFDIAHLSGTSPTASMVTFIDGEPDKRFYRHFRIRKLKQNNDTESMREVLTRRKKYFETWGKPDVLIVDGGKGQLSRALEVIGDEVPVIGLAKRYETIIVKHEGKFKGVILPKGPAKNLMQRIRDEAHRFARRYHHTLVTKTLLQKK